MQPAQEVQLQQPSESQQAKQAQLAEPNQSAEQTEQTKPITEALSAVKLSCSPEHPSASGHMLCSEQQLDCSFSPTTPPILTEEHPVLHDHELQAEDSVPADASSQCAATEPCDPLSAKQQTDAGLSHAKHGSAQFSASTDLGSCVATALPTTEPAEHEALPPSHPLQELMCCPLTKVSTQSLLRSSVVSGVYCKRMIVRKDIGVQTDTTTFAAYRQDWLIQ